MNTVFFRRAVNDVTVVIPKNAAPVEHTAAEELTGYIKKSLDITLSTVREGEETGKCIYVGKTVYAEKAGITGTETEHWLIHMHGGNLILTGGKKIGDRGIIYAAYHFLEDILGVRWWDAYTEDVPVLEELSLDCDLHKEGIPAIPFRKPYMDSQAGVDHFAQIPRTRTNVLSPLDDDIADSVYEPGVRKYGDILYMGRPHHVHVMRKYFPEDEYFDKHPEWFAYNRATGTHNKKGHFCFSNEEFKAELKKRLYAIIEEDMALAQKTGVELPYFYSLGLDDKSEVEAFCQCETCSKIIGESGLSGYELRFVNELARDVKEKYPFAKLETTAYVCFVEPPTDGTVPESNVIIRIAANTCDILRGIHAPSNRQYLRRLKTWTELCAVNGAEVHIWQYLNNGQFNYPLPIFHGLPDLIRTFRDLGGKGVFSETQVSRADNWELNKYMLTHLLENPDLDEEALVTDFCLRFYGKQAGGYVKEYLDAICRATERNPAQAYLSREDGYLNYIDSTAVVEGARALDLADAALGEEEPYRTRFNWLRKSLDGIILSKYFLLKRQAEEREEEFLFDRALLKERVAAAIRKRMEDPRFAQARYLPDELAYYTGLSDEEEVFPIPPALADIDAEDIYQYSFTDMWRWSEKWIAKLFGAEILKDEKSPLSKVLKMNIDKATYTPMRYTMRPTAKNAPVPTPMSFCLLQEDKVVVKRDLFVEDLPKDNYQLIKIGSLENIRNTHDSGFFPSSQVGIFFVNIAGLSTTYPLDACDVYLSLRTTGTAYGGNPDEENAVYFERLIIHRTKQ